MLRILVADGAPMVRAALTSLLETHERPERLYRAADATRETFHRNVFPQAREGGEVLMRVLDGREQVNAEPVAAEIAQGRRGSIRAGDSDVRRRELDRVVMDKSGYR